MNRNKSPMCNRDKRTLSEDDYKESRFDHYGDRVRRTDYSDGSSTVKWGGPCSPTNYDSNGEEC